MNILELTAGEEAAIEHWLNYWPIDDLTRAIYKLRGAKMKAEFWKDHIEDPDCDGNRVCDVCHWVEPAVPGIPWIVILDRRHDYTDEQWIEAGKSNV